MVELPVLYVAPAVLDSLRQYSSWRLLHVFDRSCNLVSPGDKVISLVSTEIGPGPFAIVLDMKNAENSGFSSFSQILSKESLVQIQPGGLFVGSVKIPYEAAPRWEPRPAWRTISNIQCIKHLRALRKYLTSVANKECLAGLLRDDVKNPFQAAVFSNWERLSASIVSGDIQGCIGGGSRIQGIGIGLTPAGDDFLMGVIYALWLFYNQDRAERLASATINLAPLRTTTLSVAWLNAAARGEASFTWHRLIETIYQDDSNQVVQAAAMIVASGHTSGADALTGFITCLSKLLEREGMISV